MMVKDKQKNLFGKKIKKEFAFNDAQDIAEEVYIQISDNISKFEIAGSIRRKKPIVHDIDMVVVAKPYLLKKIYELPNVKMISSGKKLIRFEYKGIQIDIYLANTETFETIKLIRTGSAQHNIKLCMKAQEKGWHLFADGHGLYDEKNFKTIADTEEGILIALLGKNIPPEEREK
jgi:DNA polymerase (family 10)